MVGLVTCLEIDEFAPLAFGCVVLCHGYGELVACFAFCHLCYFEIATSEYVCLSMGVIARHDYTSRYMS